MGPIRPFVQADIPQVADLNWMVLHRGKGRAPQELMSYFGDLFFANPGRDAGLPSLVYQDSRGRILGFLGIVPRRMTLCGRPIRAAFASNLVVHPDHRTNLAGLHLARAFLAGEQDLSLCDSANNLSRKVWTGLGGTILLFHSLHWSRPLRPSQYALHVLSRTNPGRLSALLPFAFRPISSLVDVLARRMPGSPFQRAPFTLIAEEPDVATLVSCLSEFSSRYSLRPLYDSDFLSWLLDFMRKRKACGELRQVGLRNQERELVGWFIYYVKPGGVGEVVHVGACNRAIGEVLDHLFHDASTHGALALHGRLEPTCLEALAEKHCFFYRRGDWVLAHSREPKLVQLLRSGDGCLTRLDGEWCMAFGSH